MAEAIMFAHQNIQTLCELQDELVQKVAPQKSAFEAPPANPFDAIVTEQALDKIRQAKEVSGKQAQAEATTAVCNELIALFFPEGTETTPEGGTLDDLKRAFHDVEAAGTERLDRPRGPVGPLARTAVDEEQHARGHTSPAVRAGEGRRAGSSTTLRRRRPGATSPRVRRPVGGRIWA